MYLGVKALYAEKLKREWSRLTPLKTTIEKPFVQDNHQETTCAGMLKFKK